MAYTETRRTTAQRVAERMGSYVREAVIQNEAGEKVKLYDPEKALVTLALMPDYVVDAAEQRIKEGVEDLNFDKLVLDKWGRRDVFSKRYVETPEVIFYRAALLIADGLSSHDQSLNYEETTKRVFEKLKNREIYPNTPYMANGGNKLLSERLRQGITENGDELRRAIPELKLEDMVTEVEQRAKVKEQLFACFVLDIYDDRKSIFETEADAAEIQASVGGTGFNFSNLRPANEMIHGTGGLTDGPIAFMRMYSNSLGQTMNQGGKRDGANMFMLDWNHPDIMRFIYCKSKDGEIPAANISAAIDYEFMKAVMAEGEDRFYPLKNPHHHPKSRSHVPKHYTFEQLKNSLNAVKLNKKAKASLLLSEDGTKVLSPWIFEGMPEDDREIGKIREGLVHLDAKKVLRHLAYGAWSNGEPGAIMTGTINDANPTHPRHFRDYIFEKDDTEAAALWNQIRGRDLSKPIEELVDEYINEKDEMGRPVNLPIGVGEMRATNPCGEKPLLGNEACVLGHVNLELMLKRSDASPSGYEVDWKKLEEDTKLMYNILDNAIDQNHFTNPDIEKTQKSNRKIGVGFMGLANMLFKMELPYGTKEAREFVDKLLIKWEEYTEEATREKAMNSGSFPNLKYSVHRKNGSRRNAIVRTIAPTGTTSTIARTTGGMEPDYASSYRRTTVQGTPIWVRNHVLEEKLDKYNLFAGKDIRNSLWEFIEDPTKGDGKIEDYQLTRADGESDEEFAKRKANLDKMKAIFSTTYMVSPKDHILMEAVVQRHVDDAISKTTNFRNNATPEEVYNAFIFAYEQGIKGITFYRDGTRKGQPLQVVKKGDKRERTEAREGGGLEVSVELGIGSDGGPVISLRRGEVEDLPEIMPALRIRQKTPHGTLVVFPVYDATSGIPELKETFASLGKSGEMVKADLEAIGRGSSLVLRLGGNEDHLMEQYEGIGGLGDESHEIHDTIRKDGRVMSLPDAFGRTIRKFKIIKKANLLGHVVTGKIKLSDVVNYVADMIRTGKMPGEKESSKDSPQNTLSTSNNNQNSSQSSANVKKPRIKIKCPQCEKAGIIVEEGCEKCSDAFGCGWAKC
ncbi:hypothetical protein J4447_03630 [Candidatus Pacearchaeota archaeon]|nr:hypothetical protein [Candidatus Pacearchaeota archaeon]